MSTATVDKDKPKAPLGSFLGKLQPKAAAEPPPAQETTHDTAPNELVPPASTDAPPDPAPVPPAPVADQAKAAEPDPKLADKEKAQQGLEKRLKDTITWGNEEHKRALKLEKELAELKTSMVRVEKKLDGTYEEPAAPSPEQKEQDAEVRGKIRASHASACKQYGKEYVMKTVWAEDSLYQELQQDPLVKRRVMEADAPVLEAIAVVKEHLDAQKYGRTPEEIRKRMEEELTPKITKQVLDGLKAKPGVTVATLGTVRGDAERTSQKAEVPQTLDFKQVFPWGAART